MNITTKNPQEAAEELFKVIHREYEEEGTSIVALKGDLGAGKTTFVQEFCKLYGVQDEVISPTFPIMNVYEGQYNQQEVLIRHFDWYRLDSPADLGVINLDQILSQKGVFFIEWPEKLPEILGNYEHFVITIENSEDGRNYSIEHVAELG